MLKFIATFVLGAACTALAGWMMVVKPIGNVFASTYLIAVMDQANIALHVRAGKPELLLHNIDPSLPTYVMAIQDHFRTHPESTNALWMVRAYYERSKLPMPTRIKDIFATLPPAPPADCARRLKALDDGVSLTNTYAPPPILK